MPRSISASSRTHARSQRSKTPSASQILGMQLQPNIHKEPEALAEDLMAVAAELAEVKEALRKGDAFLGMSGTLLQEYFIELSKKDNLLRLALSRTSTVISKRRSQTQPASRSREAGLAGDEAIPCRSQTLPPSRSRVVSSQVTINERFEAPTCSGFHQSAQPCASEVGAPSPAPNLLRACSEPTPATFSEVDVDCSNLAAVLEFLEASPQDARIQRLGMKAIGRLARDKAQLRPQCLATIWAVKHCITTFCSNLLLNRLSVTALGNLAYIPEVAALIVHEALPALFSAMVTHANDEKLQGLACEALARLMQVGELVVVKAIVHTMLSYKGVNAVPVCCTAVARLHDSGICRSHQILDALLPLTDSQADQLELQQRAAHATQRLVRAGAISEMEVKKRVPSLLNLQWAQLLARFAGADREEEEHTTKFHADVQTVFHEEVVKHFQYEAAERSLHLLQRRASGAHRLREVVRCLVENLEDYQSRLKARELAWDPGQRRLIPLDRHVREDLSAKALASMELGLIDSLQAAAAEESPHAEEQLVRRTNSLRNECAALLNKKTETTQVHQDKTMELRREVMLFEAVEHLELRARYDVSSTQIRTARHMVDLVEQLTPPEAVQRLRTRLDRLAKSMKPQMPAAVPAG